MSLYKKKYLSLNSTLTEIDQLSSASFFQGPSSTIRNPRPKNFVSSVHDTKKYAVVNILKSFQNEFSHLPISGYIEVTVNHKYTEMTKFRDFSCPSKSCYLYSITGRKKSEFLIYFFKGSLYN